MSKSLPMQIELSRCLDLRYKSRDNTYPVCIRLYHQRKSDYVKTGVYLTQTEYAALHAPRVKPQLKDVLKRISNVEACINSYLKSVSIYNIKLMRKHIKTLQEGEDKGILLQIETATPAENVFDWFDLRINRFKENEQFGSAECCRSAKNVYQEVLSCQSVSFEFFTVKKLKELESLLLMTREISVSTIGKHARYLRSVFNLALDENVISKKIYPFGRNKYVIPEVTKAKKSLTREMMAALMGYNPQSYYEERAIGYFVFSYYGNGMNLKDMALLRCKDIKDGLITFYRKKTRNTTNNLININVIVTEEMSQVIRAFGNVRVSENDYIFPIVQKSMSGKEMDTKVHTRNKSINKTLSRISTKLHFSKKLSLGMARHSSANALKQEGASLSFIQEFLGHSSPAITEHYLNSFEIAVSREQVEKLHNYYKAKNGS